MMASEGGEDHRLPRIASAIRVISDFPRPGIMFQDITTLLLDPKAFRDTIDMFVERYRDHSYRRDVSEVRQAIHHSLFLLKRHSLSVNLQLIK